MKIILERQHNRMGILLLLWLSVLRPAGIAVQTQQPPSPAGGSAISAVAFSSDGKWGAMASQGSLLVMEPGSRTVKWRLNSPGGAVSFLAFSPDGSLLASCISSFRSRSPIGEPLDYFVKVLIIETHSGRVIREANGSGGYSVRSAAFNTEGSLFVVIMRADGTVFLWNTSAGRVTQIPSRGRIVHCSAAFTPSGDKVAISITEDRENNNYEIRLYDTGTGTLAGRVAKGSSLARFHPLAFSPDGKLLAYGTEDWQPINLRRAQIGLIDAPSGRIIRRIQNINVPLETLVFSEDSRTVVATGINQFSRGIRPAYTTSHILVWDIATGKLLRKISADAQPNQTAPRIVQSALMPKQGLLCLAGSTGTVSFFDPGAGAIKVVFTPILSAAPAASTAPAAAPTAARAGPGAVVSVHRILALSFTSGSRVVAGSDDDKIYAWDLKGPGPRAPIDLALSIDSIAIAPGGAAAACANIRGGEVTVVNALSGKILRSLPSHSISVVSLAYSPAGNYLAAGGADGMVTIWDVRSWNLLPALTGHKGAVRALAFAPDSATLATGGDDRAIALWDLRTLKSAQSLKGHNQRINALAFSPDGRKLASGSDDAAVILWDLRDPGARKKLNGHRGSANSVCFSPDGALLVSGGNNMVRLWDARTGKSIGVLTERYDASARGFRREAVIYHNESVWIAAFSPDGKVLLFGGGNNALLAWDTATWRYRSFRIGA